MKKHRVSIDEFAPVERPFAVVRIWEGAGSISWKTRRFEILRQPRGSKWCWAAVSASVARYYDDTSKVCQCEIAAAVFPGKNCCKGIDPHQCENQQTVVLEKCNKAAHLEKGLVVRGNMEGKPQKPPHTFQQVVDELDNDRVVCLREDSAHFVVVVDYLGVGRRVDVRDPFDGLSHFVDYDFYSAFCTHSYRTKERT